MKPVIGADPEVSPATIHTLRQEGYIVEKGPNNEHYSYYISKTEHCESSDKKELIQKIKNNPNTLLSIHRWPEGTRCCLAVTGDIDGLDIWDFLKRFYG